MSAKPAAAGSDPSSKVPPQLQKFAFKKGQSGNPEGRRKEKPLAQILISYLEAIPPEELRKIAKWQKRKNRRKNEIEPEQLQRAQLLIMELYRRAMKGSDLLMKEILERIDGKLAADTEKERAQGQAAVIVLDMPRPKDRYTPQVPQGVNIPQRPQLPSDIPTNGNKPTDKK